MGKCSDKDFKALLEKEVSERLVALVKAGKVEHYLVFTNRKLSGLTEPKISEFIKINLDVNSCVIGNER
ncbi:MAG: hypothetical protein WCI27_11505, partial [Candidatus Omnitrophota bacterium]